MGIAGTRDWTGCSLPRKALPGCFRSIGFVFRVDILSHYTNTIEQLSAEEGNESQDVRR